MKHGKKSEQPSVRTAGSKSGKATSGSAAAKQPNGSAAGAKVTSTKSSGTGSRDVAAKASTKAAPVVPDFANSAVADAFERAAKKYGNAFKRLAD